MSGIRSFRLSLRSMNLRVLLSLLALQSLPAWSKSMPIGYWKGPVVRDSVRQDGSKAYHSFYLRVDSNGTSALYCLPTSVLRRETRYGDSGGMRFTEVGSWIQFTDTLVITNLETKAGGDEPGKGRQGRRFLIGHNRLRQMEEKMVFWRISRKKFAASVAKWGIDPAHTP